MGCTNPCLPVFEYLHQYKEQSGAKVKSRNSGNYSLNKFWDQNHNFAESIL